MGKRSAFDRLPRDFYATPHAAVLPLIPHLPRGKFRYYEPCVGSGDLCRHLSGACDGVFVGGSDIDLGDGGPSKMFTVIDALDLTEESLNCCEMIITNPPWDRKILHPMIEHFSSLRPTWLLFDADWIHTKQSARFMPLLKKVVSVGRVKWIPESKMTGKDNCAWHLFDAKIGGATEFVGRHL